MSTETDDKWKPLGWAVVPREPTHAMLDAAFRKMRSDPSCAPFSKRILLKGWDAMLETCPNISVPSLGEPEL